jgi:hypothetical protein
MSFSWDDPPEISKKELAKHRRAKLIATIKQQVLFWPPALLLLFFTTVIISTALGFNPVPIPVTDWILNLLAGI